VKIGTTVKIAHVDQARDSLEHGKTVFDAISGGNEILTWANTNPGARLHRPLQLQGRRPGQDRRQLPAANAAACTWRNADRGGNVLLLDEPSNDLDVETCAPSKTRCSNSPAA